jgi:hypothetical protein
VIPVHCKACGTLLVLAESEREHANRPRRCADCWRKTPEAIIIAEQREYERMRAAGAWERER